MSLKTLGRPEGLYLFELRLHYTYRGVKYTWGCPVRADTRDEADEVALKQFDRMHDESCNVTHITY